MVRRRNRQKSINFKETLNYVYGKVLDQEGLYLDETVDVDGLPEGIFVYYIEKDRRGGYKAISETFSRNTRGMFFTKEAMDFPHKIYYFQDRSEVILNGMLENASAFFNFFHVKLALDKQISLASEIRDKGREEESDEDGE